MNTVRHPDLTVIMPVAPGANPKPAIEALRKSIPKGVTAELITVTGEHPTRQRNLAAFRANGKILWFLDHDSMPTPDSAKQLLREFRDPRVAVAGGPNLAATPRTPFEARAGRAIASWIGSPFVTDRYRSTGEPRRTTERSLILCNLMVRREVFVAAGGFDPRLYPNEENELMHRIGAAPRAMVQVPAAVVLKGRPRTRGELIREAFRYGRGRAEEFWVAPAVADALPVSAGLVLLAALGAGVAFPWYAVGAAGFISATFLDVLLPRDLSPGFLRLMGYAFGLGVGLVGGWRTRTLRLTALPANLVRSEFRSGSFRLSESSSFDLGSITMKGAFRHA